MNEFKQWLRDNYEPETLQTIANHGCTGGIGGMIYYSETIAIYQQFCESLHDILHEYKDIVGNYPDYVIDDLGHFPSFANSVVWLCAELVAQELMAVTE